ncbi:MAG: hypothetical protein ABL901_13085 [Hyphomicrobiaceae bacterium]
MPHLEAVTYLVFVVYLLSFLAASRMAAREVERSVWLFDTGPRRQRLTLAVLLAIRMQVAIK